MRNLRIHIRVWNNPMIEYRRGPGLYLTFWYDEDWKDSYTKTTLKSYKLFPLPWRKP